MSTTLIITKDMLDAYNEYVGDADVTAWPGHIEISASLGVVSFKTSLAATGCIRALAGSGIKAGLGIKAGWGIEAGSGIKAGEGIQAGWGIEAGLGIEAGEGIQAGEGIKAGEGIQAGDGIKAVWGIEAGLGIEAGEGIEAGFSIVAKHISARLRIFAGLCMWRVPDPSEMEIRGEIRSGTIAHGTHVVPAAKEAA